MSALPYYVKAPRSRRVRIAAECRARLYRAFLERQSHRLEAAS